MSHRITAQLVRFGAVGVGTWAVGTVLYLVLRTVTGPITANVAATVAGTLLSTAVHARITFGATTTHSARAHLQAATTVVVSLGAGNAVLAALGSLAPNASTVAESAALTATGLLIGLTRFVVLRQWVFAPA